MTGKRWKVLVAISFLAGFAVAAAAAVVIFDQTIYNYFGYSLLPPVESSYPMRVIPSDSVPVYGGIPEDMLLSDTYPAGGTLAEVEAWKERIRKDMYGHNLHASTFNEEPMLDMELERDGYTLGRYSMEGLLDDRIIFWKMVPDGGSDKAVMVIPGSGNPGARDVVGEPSPWEAFYYHDEIGVSLVQGGYAVYVPELYGYGERAVTFEGCKTAASKTDQILQCGPRTLVQVMDSRGGSLGDLWDDEISKVLSVITEGKIAVAGLSLGGNLATNQLNINHDMIDAGLLVSGGATKFYAPVMLAHHGYDHTTYDSNDVILALAPKPMYLSYGLHETGPLRFEAESGHTYRLMQEAYEAYGADDGRFSYMVHGGGHEYHTSSVLEFLGKWL